MFGTVIRFERHCGFVTPDDGSKDLFIHESNVVDDVILRVNDRISFDIAPPLHNQPRRVAKNIRQIVAAREVQLPREHYLDAYKAYAKSINASPVQPAGQVDESRL